MKKKIIIGSIAFGILVLVAGSLFYFLSEKGSDDTVETVEKVEKDSVEDKKSERPVFTHKIFDPKKIEYITPLGELNGGYIESSTIGGVMIDILPSAVANGGKIEIYAPTAMKLESYGHYLVGAEPANWTLEFRIGEDVTMKIDHITDVAQRITESVGNKPKKNDSSTDFLKDPILFKAGELIAKTSGTTQANNWNIYLYDKNHENSFINQKRYEENYMGQRLIIAACPFDYYQDESAKSAFYALMGATAAGQSKTCGNPSSDVKGTLSGMWHLKKTGFEEKYVGEYANPFSIYKRSGGDIIIYEIGGRRHIIEPNSYTYKDPALVTTSHCYQLTDLSGMKESGFAYFKIDSDTQMSVVYKKTGSCPASFPKGPAKKYYR
jgi:hypothetical protein